MAKVYLAVAREPHGTKRLVVLKAMQEDLAPDSDLVGMFLDEAQLGVSLRHPNVAETLEIADLFGRPMIVMEYLEGEPLSEVLHAKEGREITQAMKFHIVAAALEGLDYIHELADAAGEPLGLVHRDVSPHNIFVTFDGRVKLLDFGIAKGLGSTGGTRTDELKGKIRYMAPEQMEGKAVDRRADVFSVGVILWEIATGHRLWHARSEVNVMRSVLTEGIPAPRSASPSISNEMNELCVKALARSPGDRHQTAAELRAELNRVLESEGANVSLKDVGALIGHAFVERRKKATDLIEAELKRDESVHLGGERFGVPAHLPSLVATTTSGSGGGAEVVARRPPRPRWLALAIALVAGGIGGALLRFHPAAQVPNRPAAPSGGALNEGGAQPQALASGGEPSAEGEPPPSVKTTKGGRVHVHLAATPATAVLYIDGSRLDKNPFDGEYPSDTGTHTVRAEAPGYVTSAAGIVLDGDVKLVLPLSRAKIAGIPPVPGVNVPSTEAPPAPASPASATTDTNPDCSPPFYFDAQGIKRLKPACI